MVTEFALGDTLTLRKPHPCGGTAWRVERLGADIGVRCLTCGHYLLLTRRRLARRVKTRLSAAARKAAESESAAPPG